MTSVLKFEKTVKVMYLKWNNLKWIVTLKIQQILQEYYKHYILKKENILPLGEISNEYMKWRFPNLYKHLHKKIQIGKPPVKILHLFFPQNYSLHVFYCRQILFWPAPSRHNSTFIWNYTNPMPIEIKMNIQHISYYELELVTKAKCFLLKQINQEAHL